MILENQEIKKYMYPNPVTVASDISVKEALEIMSEGNFRHLPVLRNNVPYSIASEREIALVLGSSSNPDEILERPIIDFCAMDLVSLSSNEPIISALNEMIDKKIGAVAIVEGNEFVGIFSVVDACKVLRSAIKK